MFGANYFDENYKLAFSTQKGILFFIYVEIDIQNIFVSHFQGKGKKGGMEGLKLFGNSLTNNHLSTNFAWKKAIQKIL